MRKQRPQSRQPRKALIQTRVGENAPGDREGVEFVPVEIVPHDLRRDILLDPLPRRGHLAAGVAFGELGEEVRIECGAELKVTGVDHDTGPDAVAKDRGITAGGQARQRRLGHCAADPQRRRHEIVPRTERVRVGEGVEALDATLRPDGHGPGEAAADVIEAQQERAAVTAAEVGGRVKRQVVLHPVKPSVDPGGRQAPREPVVALPKTLRESGDGLGVPEGMAGLLRGRPREARRGRKFGRQPPKKLPGLRAPAEERPSDRLDLDRPATGAAQDRRGRRRRKLEATADLHLGRRREQPPVLDQRRRALRVERRERENQHDVTRSGPTGPDRGELGERAWNGADRVDGIGEETLRLLEGAADLGVRSRSAGRAREELR